MFTGRIAYLQKLKEIFCNINKEKKILLLFGMGGVGKTQICLQFIKQNKTWYI